MAIDLTKEYVKLNIDVTTCIVNDDFWAKQGDTGRGFIITLVSDKQVIVPSGELVQLHLLKPDGKQVWINSDIKDGKFYIHLTNQSLMASGTMKGEFLIGSQGKVKRTETFLIDVRPSLTDGAYESTNEFGDLDILIQKIEQYAPSMEAWSEAEEERVRKENLRASAENSRVTSEGARAISESARATAETTRVSQENTRKSQETSRVNAELARVNSENTRVSQENVRQSNESVRISNETTRQTQTTIALSNISNAVNTTKIVWKSPVNTFANIATTYPNPELGWRVETLDTKHVYRYDGTAWVYISDNSATANSEVMANKGMANGYAPLDGNAKVPMVHMPDEVIIQGTYDGAVTTILEDDLFPNAIVVSDENGKISSSYINRGKLIYLENVESDIQEQINSKSPQIHTHDINDIAGLVSEIDAKADAIHTHMSSDISDMESLLEGKADNEHMHAIADITGLQTALDNMQPNISGAASTIIDNNLSPNIVLISDDSGKVSESTITEGELIHLSGVTDNIQSQLDDKAPLYHEHDYLPLETGGVVLGEIDANGGLRVNGRRVTISATAPDVKEYGDIWIKI